MLFKVGDKVTVRPDLSTGNIYYMRNYDRCQTVVAPMMDLAGKVVTISDDFGYYHVYEDPGRWNWADEMFCEGIMQKVELPNDNLMDFL